MTRIQMSRPTMLLPAALVSAALFGSACGSSEPSGNVAQGPATGDAVRVEANDGQFNPASLRLPVGREVVIEIRNEDETAHDFAVESLGINTGIIEPGDAATATITVPDRTIEFECTLHGGMSGVIEPR